MEIIKLREDYIKLGQALKAAGLAESGVEAKYAAQDGLVSVNGETVYQRGKKLVDGDVVTYKGETIKITKLQTGRKIHDYRIHRTEKLPQLQRTTYGV